MVIAQLSDIHAGYGATHRTTKDGVNVREWDGYVALDRMVTQICDDDTVDVVLICGDVFHTPNPSVRAVVEVQRQLRRFAARGLPVYILTGNHDTNDIASDMAATALVDDRDRGIIAHCDPYHVHELSDGIVLHMVSHHAYRDQEDTFRDIQPVHDAVNIFTTHGSCWDPVLGVVGHTQSSPREVIIPETLLAEEEWTYRLLGHIHERGWVGSTDGHSDTSHMKTFYNGSLIRRGFADGECELGRGWTSWEIRPDGSMTPTCHTVPQRPQFDLPVVDATGLSGDNVTDRVLNAVSATHIQGATDYDMTCAPLVRQRLINVSPATQHTINKEAIHQATRHALSFAMPISRPETETSARTLQPEASTAASHPRDMVQAFRAWKDTSEVLGSLSHKNVRRHIEKDAEHFVSMSQEAVLNQGE